jgi:formaldehyde-activating enzyme
MKIAEGFAGPPVFEVAHIDLLMGSKGGPVTYAIEEVIKRREAQGNDPSKFIMDRPRTLLVPTVTVRTKRQAGYIYEDASEGVVLAIEKSIADGVLPDGILDRLDIIANVFVHPAARNRQRIKFNNYKAMLHAVKRALEGRPTLDEIMYEKAAARHPFRYEP